MSGTLLTRGTRRGQAAKGEYGNDALLTTSGLVVMRDPTSGLWVPKKPPGYLFTENRGATISNPGAVATSILSGNASIANAWMAGVAQGDAVEISAAGSLLWSTAAQTVVFDLYHGASILTSITSPSYTAATARPWQLHIEAIYTAIAGAGAGAMRFAKATFIVGGVGGGWQGISTSAGLQLHDGASITPTQATNVAQALDLKVTPSIGTATTTLVLNELVVRHCPKNY